MLKIERNKKEFLSTKFNEIGENYASFTEFMEYELNVPSFYLTGEELIEQNAVYDTVFELNHSPAKLYIGKAKYVRDDFGFVDNIFCHKSRVPIESLDGQWCMALYEQGPKGPRANDLFSLSSCMEDIDDGLFSIFNSKLETRITKEEEAAKRLADLEAKRKAEEEARNQKLIELLGYIPEFKLEKRGGNYGSPTIYSLEFKTSVDKETVVKAFKICGLEEFHNNSDLPIQDAYGEIRRHSESIWKFYDFPEYTD